MDIMMLGEKNPNYLGSFDLYDLTPQELTGTIKDIKEEAITTNGQKQVVTTCYFDEGYKPMILNPTNKKRLAKLYGTKESTKLVGKQITIVIEKVKAFGKLHDALRIKEEIPKKKSTPALFCENCTQPIQAIGDRSAEYLAGYTKQKYGKQLCAKCAAKLKKQMEESKEQEANNEQAQSDGK